MPEIPTLHVVGRAEREVTPDEVTVTLQIDSPLRPTAARALADASEMRRRVATSMATRFPDITPRDQRITVHEQITQVERRSAHDTTETHDERMGFTAHCAVTLRADAGRTGDLVAHGGAHPDVGEVHPRFALSATLARAVELELEQNAVRDGLERAAGLADAAGHAVGGIASIGESPTNESAYAHGELYDAHVSDTFAADGDQIADALGEIRPEPETRAAQVPVRVTLTSR